MGVSASNCELDGLTDVTGRDSTSSPDPPYLTNRNDRSTSRTRAIPYPPTVKTGMEGVGTW